MPRRFALAVLDPPEPSSQDRRVAQRTRAEDAPWIVTVKPGLGNSAKLIDISRTGLLMETPTRFLPGAKGIVILNLAEGLAERMDGVVVRSQLWAIARGSGVLYQVGFMFGKEFDRLAGDQPIAPAPEEGTADVIVFPQSDEIYDALWTATETSRGATVVDLSEAGCTLRTAEALETGQRGVLTVFFSPTRPQILVGRILNQVASGYELRFEGLSSDDRRALRIELRTSRASRPSPQMSSGSPTGDNTQPFVQFTRVVPFRGGGSQANAW